MTETRKAVCAATLLFVVNVVVCHRLFGIEYLNKMQSIEAAYIALTRYTLAHWPDVQWFPLWYGGMPYQSAYQPGLPLASAWLSAMGGFSPARAFHIVVALLYSVGPVGLLLLVWRVTRNLPAAVFSGLCMSLVSPAAFLLPLTRWDMGSVWFARRLHTLIEFGEGPNVSGLSLLPFALLGVHAVAERLTPWRVLWAGLALALVVLVSWPSALVTAAAVLCYLLARDLFDLRVWLRLFGLAVFAYSLLAVWVPPSTILLNQHNSQFIGHYPWTRMHGVQWPVVLLGLAGLHVLGRKLRWPTGIRFGVNWSYLLGSIPIAAYWLGINLLPQPERFHLAMELGLAVLAGCGLAAVLQRWPVLWRPALAALLVGFLLQGYTYLRYARFLIRSTDIQQTVEYQISNWVDAHLPGERVFASGSVAFWMNAWTDVPQMTGCCLPGVVTQIGPMASYVITSGQDTGERDAEISLLWLRAMGVQAVVTGGPKSREHFHDFRNASKFQGKVPLLWQQGDDMIWRVPQRSQSLAHVIPAAARVPRTPVNGIDVAPLQPYVAALQDATLPDVAWRWQSQREGIASGRIPAGTVLSVQQTYIHGWHAEQQGQSVAVEQDGIGQIIVKAQPCEQPCEVRLFYDGGTEAQAMRVLTGAGLGGWVLWWVHWRQRRNRASAAVRPERIASGTPTP